MFDGEKVKKGGDLWVFDGVRVRMKVGGELNFGISTELKGMSPQNSPGKRTEKKQLNSLEKKKAK